MPDHQRRRTDQGAVERPEVGRSAGDAEPEGVPEATLRLLLEDSAEDLYENAPCGYLSLLLDGTVVKVNTTFLGWTARSRESLVGKVRFPDLLTVGGRIFWDTHLAPMLRLQHAFREIAVDLLRADGEPLPVLLNSRVRYDDSGVPVVVRVMVLDATERTAYERELLRARQVAERSEARVRELQEVAAQLSAVAGTAGVAEVVARAGVDVFAALGADVWVVHPESGELRVAAGAGARSGDGVEALRPSPLVGEALRTGQAAFVPTDLVGRRVEAAVLPLVVDDVVLGVLDLRLDVDRPLSDADRTALRTLAGQCALAVSRARLHEQAVLAANRSAFLAGLSRALEETRTSAGRAERLADLAVPDLAEHAAVLLPDDDGGWRLAAERRAVGNGQAGAFPAQALSSTPSMPEEWGVAASRATATESPQALASLPDAVAAGASGGGVVLPLRAPGRGLGALVLVRTQQPFWSSEVVFLVDVADRGGLALENARLYEQEHEVAHALQRSLLPDRLVADERVAVVPHYLPAVQSLEVGGDWYDAFLLGPDLLAVCVGDVVGRGLTAAAAMGQLRSAIRALATAGEGPARLLERLDGFVEHVETAQMATVAYLELDLATGKARYACAGHPPPVLVKPDEAAELVWGGRGTPLGAWSGRGGRSEDELELAPGAQLLLYTDGLVERRRESLTDRLNLLVAEVEARRDLSPPALVRAVTETLLRDAENADDVCLLVLARRDLSPLLLTLPARFERLAWMRRELRRWLERVGVGGDDVDAVVLAASEAAANAIEHGVGSEADDVPEPVRVSARRLGGAVEVTVRDPGLWRLPAGAAGAVGEQPSAGERGRGLFLMRRLMDSVEVRAGDGTEVVLRREVRPAVDTETLGAQTLAGGVEA